MLLFSYLLSQSSSSRVASGRRFCSLLREMSICSMFTSMNFYLTFFLQFHSNCSSLFIRTIRFPETVSVFTSNVQRCNADWFLMPCYMARKLGILSDDKKKLLWGCILVHLLVQVEMSWLNCFPIFPNSKMV